jgi:RNA-directed DNA polymerase
MKRYGNLYEKVCSMDNLREAHKNARRGKTNYKEVKMVDANEDYYLYNIHKMLINKEYKTSPYINFEVDDKGKIREISKLPYYPDRIVHWAIMLQTKDVFERTFIYDSYASIPEKGTHKLINKMNAAMQNKKDTQYCLKIDIKKYFPNVDKYILKAMLRKKFKDDDLLWLFDEIVDSYDKGLPIGNYISQYLSNYYLTYFDHWVKEHLKIKHYYRYMDDIVILHHDKLELRFIKLHIDNYLKTELKLKIKSNWQIFPTFVRGVDFLGYRLFGDYTLLRKKIAQNIKKKCRSIDKLGAKQHDINSIMSYMGWLMHCNAYNFTKKYINPIVRRVEKYESIVKHKQATRLLAS